MSEPVRVAAFPPGWTAVLLGVALSALGGVPAAAQEPAPAVEAIVGWAGFVDESLDHHGVAGAGFKFPLTSRVSIGPELLYMKGGPGHRDIVIAGNVSVNLMRPDEAPLMPLLVGSVGVLHLKDRIGPSRFTAFNEFFTIGFGARLPVSESAYLAPDVRLGIELHWRTTVALGIRLD